MQRQEDHSVVSEKLERNIIMFVDYLIAVKKCKLFLKCIYSLHIYAFLPWSKSHINQTAFQSVNKIHSHSLPLHDLSADRKFEVWSLLTRPAGCWSVIWSLHMPPAVVWNGLVVTAVAAKLRHVYHRRDPGWDFTFLLLWLWPSRCTEMRTWPEDLNLYQCTCLPPRTFYVFLGQGFKK